MKKICTTMLCWFAATGSFHAQTATTVTERLTAEQSELAFTPPYALAQRNYTVFFDRLKQEFSFIDNVQLDAANAVTVQCNADVSDEQIEQLLLRFRITDFTYQFVTSSTKNQ